MNIDTLKVELLEDIINTYDQNIISKVKEYLNKLKSSPDVKPMTNEEFLCQIDHSRKDFKEGRVSDHSELRSRYSKK